MNQLALTFGILLAVFLGGLEALLLWFIWKDKINLSFLVSEKGGAASLSRFQFLIFTFVIAMSFFLVVANDPTGLPDVPSGVFALLGISGGSYVISKGIQGSDEKIPPAPDEKPKPATDPPDEKPKTGAEASS